MPHNADLSYDDLLIVMCEEAIISRSQVLYTLPLHRVASDPEVEYTSPECVTSPDLEVDDFEII